MEKISFEDFMNSETAIIPDEIPTDDYIQLRSTRTFLFQMADVTGEVIRLVRRFEDWKNNNTDERKYHTVVNYLNIVHKFCYIVHSCPNVTDEEKRELKQAQWELYDYCLWGNERKNDAKSVMKWFDQCDERYIDELREGNPHERKERL